MKKTSSLDINSQKIKYKYIISTNKNFRIMKKFLFALMLVSCCMTADAQRRSIRSLAWRTYNKGYHQSHPRYNTLQIVAEDLRSDYKDLDIWPEFNKVAKVVFQNHSILHIGAEIKVTYEFNGPRGRDVRTKTLRTDVIRPHQTQQIIFLDSPRAVRDLVNVKMELVEIFSHGNDRKRVHDIVYQ